MAQAIPWLSQDGLLEPSLVVAFLLLWVRAGVLLFSAAPFSRNGIPALPKAGLSGLLAALLLPGLSQAGVAGVDQPVGLALAVAREVLAGIALSLPINLAFAAVMLGGQLIDFPMGFGMVNVVDPQFGSAVPLVGQFHTMVATLVFFGVNGHHQALTALYASARAVPPGAFLATPALGQAVVDAFAAMFVAGLRFALPVMGALFVADVALAVVSRAVPQMNVFVVGFPLKIALGLLAVALALPAFVALVRSTFEPGGSVWEQVRALLLAGAGAGSPGIGGSGIGGSGIGGPGIGP